MQFSVHEFESVSSTNDIVKRAIEEGAAPGYVAVAQTQTAGYGRRGNKWSSPRGGLYLSILLQPSKKNKHIATLGMLAALAIRETLSQYLPEYARPFIQLKWPNDVVYTGPEENIFNKIAGISTEKIGDKVCLGIGINIEKPTAGHGLTKSESRNEPTYLSDLIALDHYRGSQEDISIESVRSAFLSQFEQLYNKWDSGEFEDFIHLINKYSALRGKAVSVTQARGITEGVVQKIANDGALMVEVNNSDKIIAIHEGTVTLA